MRRQTIKNHRITRVAGCQYRVFRCLQCIRQCAHLSFSAQVICLKQATKALRRCVAKLQAAVVLVRVLERNPNTHTPLLRIDQKGAVLMPVDLTADAGGFIMTMLCISSHGSFDC